MSCAGSGIPPTNTSPATTRAAKPPHGHPVNLRSLPGPSQRQEKPSWGLDREEEEEEQPSDTAVDAGSSEPLASSTLPKDNDDNDNGSEYVASSDEDPGPGPKRSRESARLRRVHAPSERAKPHALAHESIDLSLSLSQPRTRPALRFLKWLGGSARTHRAWGPCQNAPIWSRPVVDVASRRDRRQNPTVILHSPS